MADLLAMLTDNIHDDITYILIGAFLYYTF